MSRDPQHFADALAWIMEIEGGYVDDPDDAGGQTKHGISDAGDGRVDGMADLDGDGAPDVRVIDLTAAHAGVAYRQRYWNPCRCDELPRQLAIATFDGAVNSGPRTAIVLLQQALRVKADGLIGPRTLVAAHTSQSEAVLLDLLGRRALFYHDITRADSRKVKFLRGWFNRLFRLQRFLLAHPGPDRPAAANALGRVA